MITQFTNIKKLILLGFAVASTKVMLLLFAYFFDSETYNQFNQIYYTASLIILFSSLGFNIAITRIRIKSFLVALSVIINALITYTLLYVFSEPFANTFEIISVLVYSICISITGIYVFQLLFSSKYKEYVILTISYSLLHLLVIPSILFLDLNLFVILPIISVCWLTISIPKFIRQKESSFEIKEFYKIGVSAFVINSAVSLALAADKYFVNHFFELDIANSYTFAWGLTAPIFYIGVIIEQFLFSESNTSKSNILKRGFLFSTTLVVFYALAMLTIINFFPGVIPSSVNQNYVVNITSLMLAGYSLYVIVHFPVNAYLFKSLGTDTQKTISIIFSIIISVFVALYIFIMKGTIEINYYWLLIITWSYIFTLLFAKVLIMFKRQVKEGTANTIIGIQNWNDRNF